jgi:hypothetical protein
MTGQKAGSGSRYTPYVRQNFSVITDARTATSEEHAGRVRRYAITMGFRTACFIAMIFVPGFWRWVLFACAVFLPYVAVLLANQAHQRGATDRIETPAPEGAKQLTTGVDDADVIEAEVVDGKVDGAPDQRGPRTDAGST